MPRKTMFLIIFLAVAAGFFLFLAFSEVIQPKKHVSPSPTASLNQPTSLMIIKDSLSLTTGSSSATLKNTYHQTLNVVLDTPNSIRTLQLDLSYDPTSINHVKIAKGQFLSEGTELFNIVDQKNGRISFALSIPQSLPLKKGNGIVAVISFDYIPGQKQNTIDILFLPKTQVMTDNIQGSILSKSTGITLQIPSTSILPKIKQASSSAK